MNPIQANDRTFRLVGITTVTPSYAEPADPKMFHNGQPASGISLAMENRGDGTKPWTAKTATVRLKNVLFPKYYSAGSSFLQS